ncbi:hypothetical protein Rhopal_007568-T1 [Rhodotorula paludigena]|uniref:Uncharacterized protein n=1 Tax=Rhodotorula paludigena TaxID=86838 RepID=A0AAV5GY80_9BASI|nr:hypothetical protein Rhopal_007568-T1 [Rhodotorula paludigena]
MPELMSDVDLDPFQRAKQKRKKAVEGFMPREKDGLCKSWSPMNEEAHLFCARLTMQMVSELGVGLCWVQTRPSRDFFVNTALPTHACKDLPFDWDRKPEETDQFWKWEGEKRKEMLLDVDGYKWYPLTVGASALFLHYNVVNV